MQNNKTLLLFSILLAVFVVPSSISGTAIALPFIAQELGNEAVKLQWVVNALNLFFASFTLIWGAMSDRFGARKCLLFGVFVYLVGSFLSVVAQNLMLLDVARALAGVGGASVFACGASLLIKNFEEQQRAKAFAFFGTTAGLGLTFGPTISGLLIDLFEHVQFLNTNISYRSIFVFHFLVLGAVLLLGPTLPKDLAQDLNNNKFDTVGAFLFVVLLFSFMVFISNIAHMDNNALIALAVCFVSALFFSWQQKAIFKKGFNPLLDFDVLKNKKFFGYTLVTVIAGFSFVVLLTYFPSFLQAAFGLSASLSGLFMLALTSPMLFCPLVVSKLLNAGINATKLALLMSLMMSLGLLVLAFVLVSDLGNLKMSMLIVLLFIIGVGMGLHAGGIDNLALSSVDSTKSGLAAGVLNSFRLGSEAIGVALYGALMLVFITSAVTGLGLDNALIAIIASANTAALDAQMDTGIEIYIQAFFYVMLILSALCLLLSGVILKLLKHKD